MNPNTNNDYLLVIDMQNDFVTGALGSKEAQEITNAVNEKITNFNGPVIFTRDTHYDNYLDTNEGKFLPIKHCIKDTNGWQIIDSLDKFRIKNDCLTFDKEIFGSIKMVNHISDLYSKGIVNSVTLIGLCTDICVVSNVLMLRTMIPELKINVDSNLCAGTTPENHNHALQTMKSCNITIL